MTRNALRRLAIALPCAIGPALLAGPAPAQTKPTAPAPVAPAPSAPTPAPVAPIPAPAASAPAEAPQTFAAQPAAACGAKAALYVGDKAFQVFVTRIGRARVENPLRPLTPDLTEVLQVTIAGRMATAYGADLGALRRGGPPNALEAQLGGPIVWDAALPLLPDPLTIVGEAGEPLARLGFRDCVDPPPVKAPPAVARTEGKPGRGGATRKPGAEAGRQDGERKGDKRGERRGQAAAPKVPPGFTLPQGAVAE